jgi:hypothetical protein
MVEILKKLLVSLILLGAVLWMLMYARAVHITESSDSLSENVHESCFYSGLAEVHYRTGLLAWYENKPVDAIKAFNRAVSIFPLHVDAWLKSVEAHQAAGDQEMARRVLEFTDSIAGDVVQWNWDHVLLSRQLGMQDMFVRNANLAVSEPKTRNQALDLMDIHFSRNTSEVLMVLEDYNLGDYLQWLISRKRIDGSMLVWEKMAGKVDIDEKLYQRYSAFLIRERQVQAAVSVHKQYTGHEDEIVNPGFENFVSNKVFGWWAAAGEGWDVRRDSWEAYQGHYSLQIRFDGKKNLNFYHVRQYVPVKPGQPYSLFFRWKGHSLGTDRRPFIEIRGIGGSGGYWKSNMAEPDFRWKKEQIQFTPEDDCHAVMIRLRRLKSHRFDNKIAGILWMDDFALEPADKNHNNNF